MADDDGDDLAQMLEGLRAQAAVAFDHDETDKAASPVTDDAISPADVRAAERVLLALVSKQVNLRDRRFRTVRTCVSSLFTDQIAAQLFQGVSVGAYVNQKLVRRQFVAAENARKAEDIKKRDAVRKRAQRRNHLLELGENVYTAPLYYHMLAGNAAPQDPEHNSAASPVAAAGLDVDDIGGTVHRRVNCYVCKRSFYELHHHYELLCPPCAAFNWERRRATRDLTGRIALVTGGRVKIGFEICLLLLRAGAAVIVTTRFPKEAALRYTKEADHAAWSHRLHVYALDLRDLAHVECFCAHLDRTLPRLDIIVNNACQTVRRPTGYYAHLLQIEATPLDLLPVVAQSMLSSSGSAWFSLAGATCDSSSVAIAGGQVAVLVGDVAQSVRLSQVAVVADDELSGASVLPQGQFDINGQQVDTRRDNSWRQKLGEVATGEAVECMAINALSPFIINGQLRALMQRTDPALDKYIVNVTAMEGVFYRVKQPTHPHTNMAKSALNQMVVTSARDYAQQNIFMTAVDTGWVNDENPVHITAQKESDMYFAPPLDEVDGAARVVDPIFNGKRQFGVFLKNYHENDW